MDPLFLPALTVPLQVPEDESVNRFHARFSRKTTLDIGQIVFILQNPRYLVRGVHVQFAQITMTAAKKRNLQFLLFFFFFIKYHLVINFTIFYRRKIFILSKILLTISLIVETTIRLKT